jgi:molybdate transport system substrate-binding protein
LEDVLGQLLVDYALQQPRVQVRAIYGASDALADQVLTGTPTDLFLSADDRQMDRLEAASLIRSESRLTLAENTLMAIGPADQNHTVRRPADLLREGISRIAVAAPPCPLGVYTRAYLEHEGIYHSLQRRLLYVENSHSVLAAVRSGEVDIGLIYASDAGGGHETRLLFQARRPALPIRYTGAILTHGQNTGRAEALLDFLTSPLARRRFRSCGFSGIRPRRS